MTEAVITDVQNEDDGLTPEERAAINSNDDIIDDGQGGGDGAAASGEDNGAGAAGDPPVDGGNNNAESGDPKPGADAEGGASGEQGATAEQDASAPILVVQPPADAEAKLAEIGTKKEELHAKFDDGDITAREYQQQLDALNKQERDIELDLREAKLAEKMEAQRQANDWTATVNSFISEHPRYAPGSRMYQMLDLEVRSVATSDEFKSRTDSAAGREILKKAHENLAKELGFDPNEGKQPATKEAKKPTVKPDAVPSLHKVPAADMSDTGEGKYAALDRLQVENPIAYEEALMRMPQHERDAYLATA